MLHFYFLDTKRSITVCSFAASRKQQASIAYSVSKMLHNRP